MAGVGRTGVEFDAPALYLAVQNERSNGGLSWRELEAQLGVKSATMRRLGRSPLHVDHDAELVLRLATWVRRSVESFVPHGPPGAVVEVDPESVRLPGGQLLGAIDARRTVHGLTWRQTAAELGIGVSTLEHVARGGRVRLKLLLLACDWLGCSTAELVAPPRPPM